MRHAVKLMVVPGVCCLNAEGQAATDGDGNEGANGVVHVHFLVLRWFAEKKGGTGLETERPPVTTEQPESARVGIRR